MSTPTDLLVDAISSAVVAQLQPVLDDLARPEPAPALLTRAQLAKQLGTSIASVDRLVRRGAPYVRLGDHRRFRLAAVLAWLEQPAGAEGSEA